MEYVTIVIGDELLIGQVQDTNSGYIARLLQPHGWHCRRVVTIGDGDEEITRAIKESFTMADVVLMTGGLGPTRDDITKQVLCRFFGGTLVMNSDVMTHNERMFASRGVAMNESTRSQALVPSSCRVIPNDVGTAPVLWFERDGKVLVAMPGVPSETRHAMECHVRKTLLERFLSSDALEHRTLVVAGITESALAERLAPYENTLPATVHLAYLPAQGVIRLRLTGTGNDRDALTALMDDCERRLDEAAHDVIIAHGDKPLALILGEHLRQRGLTIATAESCTGGNIAHAITAIAGSSDYFTGSVVSYANDVKADVLGVSRDDLAAHGAVSEPVVRCMADGVAQLMHTDCAVATSGIAGPGGGTPEKPVGTVWIAARSGDTTISRCHHFSGTREMIIDRATNAALLHLLDLLRTRDKRGSDTVA